MTRLAHNVFDIFHHSWQVVMALNCLFIRYLLRSKNILAISLGVKQPPPKIPHSSNYQTFYR